MINNILFVCIGNICRSPMAEALFRQALPEKQLFSAGLDALVGHPADPLSVQLMKDVGIDISNHRARNLEAWMVLESDLILTMDLGQKMFLERAYPFAKEKVMRVGEHIGCDIPDPYRKGMPAFRNACELIMRCMDHWVPRIMQHSVVQQGDANAADSASRPLAYTPP